MSSDAPKIYRAQSSSPWPWIIGAALCLLLLLVGASVYLALMFLKSSAVQPPMTPLQAIVLPTAPEVAPAPPPPAQPIVPVPPPDSPLARIDSHRVLHLPLVNSLEDLSDKKQGVIVHRFDIERQNRAPVSPATAERKLHAMCRSITVPSPWRCGFGRKAK